MIELPFPDVLQAEAYYDDRCVLIRNSKTENVAERTKRIISRTVVEVPDFASFLNEVAPVLKSSKVLVALGDSTSTNVRNWPYALADGHLQNRGYVVLNLSDWARPAEMHVPVLDYCLDFISKRGVEETSVILLVGLRDVHDRLVGYENYTERGQPTFLSDVEEQLRFHRYGAELARLTDEVPTEPDDTGRWIASRTLACAAMMERLCSDAGARFRAVIRPSSDPDCSPGYIHTLRRMYDADEVRSGSFYDWCREHQYVPDLTSFRSRDYRPFLDELRATWRMKARQENAGVYLDWSDLFRDINDCCFHFDAVHFNPLGAKIIANAVAKLLAEDSDDPAVHTRLGGLLTKSGDLPGAERALRKAVELQPGLPSYRINLARVMNRAGKFEEAASLLRDVVANGAGGANNYAMLGHVLLQARDLEGAEKAFRKAVKLNPNGQAFRRSLATVLDRRGLSKKAIDLLRPVVEDGTADQATCALFVHMLSRLRDLAGMEKAIRRAIELHPDDLKFQVVLADHFIRQERHDEAVAVLREVPVATATDARLLFRIGCLFSRVREPMDAEQAIRRAIELEPTNHEYRITLADMLLRWRRRAEALVLLWELKADGSAQAHIRELWTKALGNLVAAEQVLRKELSARPGDLGLRGALAEILCEQQRFGEAMKVLLNRNDHDVQAARIQRTLERVWDTRGSGSTAPVPSAKAEHRELVGASADNVVHEPVDEEIL